MQDTLGCCACIVPVQYKLTKYNNCINTVNPKYLLWGKYARSDEKTEILLKTLEIQNISVQIYFITLVLQ